MMRFGACDRINQPFRMRKACDIILNGNARTQPGHFDPTLLEAFRERHLEFDGIFSEIREEESTP